MRRVVKGATETRPGRIRESRLSNGIRVLTETMPGVRSAAVGAWVRQGSAHEPADAMGASHLLEHLVFKGTERRSAREIAMALESLGGSLDAYTGREQTSFQARVLDEHVPRALEVVADLIRRPSLRPDDLELEREVVLEELSTVQDTPDDLVFELHSDRIWAGHPYGHSILGTRETVSGMSSAALRELHRERYLVGDLVVGATGSVDHDAVVADVETHFGDLPKAGERPEIPPVKPRIGGVERVHRETAQTHLVFGAPIPGHADERRYPLVLLSSAFGGGMSSRLFQRVREELALAYTVYSFQSFYSRAGLTGVYVGTRPGWGDRVTDAVLEEHRRLASAGLTEAELEQTKQQVKGQIMLSLESTGSRLYRLASFALFDEPFLSLDEVLARIDAVGPDEISAVAADFFDPARQFVLRLGPEEDEADRRG